MALLVSSVICIYSRCFADIFRSVTQLQNFISKIKCLAYILQDHPHTSQTQDTWKGMIPFSNGLTWTLFILTLNWLNQSHNSIKKKKIISSILKISPPSSVSQRFKPSLFNLLLESSGNPCCWNIQKHTISRRDSLTIICCITVQQRTVADYSCFRRGKFEAQSTDALFTKKIREYWFQKEKSHTPCTGSRSEADWQMFSV